MIFAVFQLQLQTFCLPTCFQLSQSTLYIQNVEVNWFKCMFGGALSGFDVNQGEPSPKNCTNVYSVCFLTAYSFGRIIHYLTVQEGLWELEVHKDHIELLSFTIDQKECSEAKLWLGKIKLVCSCFSHYCLGMCIIVYFIRVLHNLIKNNIKKGRNVLKPLNVWYISIHITRYMSSSCIQTDVDRL